MKNFILQFVGVYKNVVKWKIQVYLEFINIVSTPRSQFSHNFNSFTKREKLLVIFILFDRRINDYLSKLYSTLKLKFFLMSEKS